MNRVAALVRVVVGVLICVVLGAALLHLGDRSRNNARFPDPGLRECLSAAGIEAATASTEALASVNELRCTHETGRPTETLDGLELLTRLETFNLVGAGDGLSMGAISRVSSLTRLVLDDPTLVSCVSIAAARGLERLTVVGGRVDTVECVGDLASAPALRELRLLGVHELSGGSTSAAPFDQLVGLRTLAINGDLERHSGSASGSSRGAVAGTDVRSFPGLPPGLTHLSLADTHLLNLDGIERVDGLETLDISWTQVTDLSPLTGSAISRLVLSGVPATDFSVLPSMTSLTELSVDATAHSSAR